MQQHHQKLAEEICGDTAWRHRTDHVHGEILSSSGFFSSSTGIEEDKKEAGLSRERQMLTRKKKENYKIC